MGHRSLRRLGVLSLLLVACSGSDTTGTDNAPWELSVTTVAGQQTILVGDQTTLTVDEIRDGVRRAVANSELEWRIVSGAAVTVNSSGIIVTVQPGTSVIEAKRGDRTVTFTITVAPRPLASIDLATVAALVRGDTVATALTGADDHGAAHSVTNVSYTSRAPGIVKALDDGRLVALETGTAEIVAASGTLKDSIAVQVTLGEVTDLGMSLANSITAGDSVLATFAPVDRRGNHLTGVPITFWSGNTMVADVRAASTTGEGSVWVKAKVAGISNIHATSGIAASSVLLTVGAARLLALHAGASGAFFFWQDSVSLNLTGDYGDGSTVPVTTGVTWSVLSGSDRFSIANGWVRTVGAPASAGVRRDVGAVATVRATVGTLSSDLTVRAGSQRPTAIQVTGPATATQGDVITFSTVYLDSLGTAVPAQRMVGAKSWTVPASATTVGTNQWQLNVVGDATFVAVYSEEGVAPVTTSKTVTVSAVVVPPPPPPPPPPSGYVELGMIGSMTPAVEAAFTTARDRINQVIPFSNATPVSMTVTANACGTGSPAFSQIVQGVYIFAIVDVIDGPGGILGQAGPCYVRSLSPKHPIIGLMRFDVADLNSMVSNGTITPVILHEMLHVMGIGTMWSYTSYTSGIGGADPRWSGPLSKAQYQLLGAADYASGVPIENTGGSGTRDAHWREATFGSELMTGWVNGSSAPFSRMTMASLADEGYTVSYDTADPFTLPSSIVAGMGVPIGTGELLEQPLYVVSPSGAVAAIAGAKAWRDPKRP